MAGVDRRLLKGIQRSGAAIVLSLHRVSPERNDYFPPIHPQAFEGLVAFLVAHFRVTTLAAAAAPEPDSRPVAVLSFDDGYHDFVEHAMPILDRYRVPANQNVIASTVLSASPPWTQRLVDFLSAAPVPLLRELRLAGFDRRPPSVDPRERELYAVALVGHLTKRTRAERAELLEHLERQMSRLDLRTTRMMDARDVREAARAGHEIGSHSFDHDPMDVETLDHFREDLDRCSGFFREHLAMPLEVYAFPFGRHRPEQVDLLRSRGMRAILVVGERYATTDGPVYPRFTVGSTDPYLLRLEALGVRARGPVGRGDL